MSALAFLALLAAPAQEEYYPLDEGTVWTYQTHAGKAYVQKVLGTEKVGNVPCVVRQHGDTEHFWLSRSAEGVSVHRAKGVAFEAPLLLFKFPLRKGDAWRGAARSASDALRYSFENAGEEEVEVPAGKFKAFRVDWTLEEGALVTKGATWLACGVGMVKERYQVKGVESGLELVSVRRAGGHPYLPLAKGNRWTFQTIWEGIDLVYEIVGTEKVGEVECFVVEHRTQNRVLRKEWLAVSEEGVRIHQLQRGKSILPVEKPYFKLKADPRKGDEWGGNADAEENPVKAHYRVEGEEEVEVPAGKFKAVKVKVKIESGASFLAEGWEWYAKDMGIVKSELTLTSRQDSLTMTNELKEFKKP